MLCFYPELLEGLHRVEVGSAACTLGAVVEGGRGVLALLWLFKLLLRSDTYQGCSPPRPG